MIHENIMYITHSKRQKMGEEKKKKKTETEQNLRQLSLSKRKHRLWINSTSCESGRQVRNIIIPWEDFHSSKCLKIFFNQSLTLSFILIWEKNLSSIQLTFFFSFILCIFNKVELCLQLKIIIWFFSRYLYVFLDLS